MVERVIKRDGRHTKFSKRRIVRAVSRAMDDSKVSRYNSINQIVDTICNAINVKFDSQEPTVEQIQDTIVEILKEMKLNEVADAYLDYRDDRTRIRETKSDIMKAIDIIGKETIRDNANVGGNFSAKLLQIASVANKWYNLAKMPKEHAKAHENGDIHIHDVDSFNLTVNCLQHDLEKMFKRGFNTGYGTINPPKRIESAAEQACIILQAAQNDCYGGQSFADFDNAFIEPIKKTRQEVREDLEKTFNSISGKSCNDYPEAKEVVEEKVNERVHQAMQGIAYNLNTLHSRAGSQVPFSSINVGYIQNGEDAALVCKAFLEEYSKGMGKGEAMIFPNIIFRLKKGHNTDKNDPYRYLTDLAIKVAARRMNPTFLNLDASINKGFMDKGILPAIMGCRTYIGSNVNGEEGPTNRGNIAPVSINLPRLGIEAKGSLERFYKMLDKTMDLCEEELLYRYDVLKNLKVKDLPFVAGEHLIKGSENLSIDDSIEPILRQGTWGIGYIGLAETLIALKGHHHGEGQEYWDLAYEIVKHMRERVDSYRDKNKLNFTFYGTPAEGLSSRFTNIDRKKYGIIPGVTDKDYYTNSFHIPVKFPISALDKAGLEAPFHKIHNAGHITYFEMDGGTVEEREEFIRRTIDIIINNTDISYFGFNFHIRYCKDCGIEVAEHMSSCHQCGSNRIQGVSRVTGYLSLDERFTPGKVAERADRVKHTF